MTRPIEVLSDSSGEFLVAVVGPEDERLWWLSWRVGRGRTFGPNCLGNWFRFMPSDWDRAAGPLPEDVQRVVDWAASIEDLDQVVIRDGRGWLPREGGDQPPGM